MILNDWPQEEQSPKLRTCLTADSLERHNSRKSTTSPLLNVSCSPTQGARSAWTEITCQRPWLAWNRPLRNLPADPLRALRSNNLLENLNSLSMRTISNCSKSP